MQRERILVVANSRKLGGRCIAGVSLDQNRLVRPISPVGNGALSDSECQVDGRTPKLLEVVTFEHEGGGGDPAQPENVTIVGKSWKSGGSLDPQIALDVLLAARSEDFVLLGNRGRAVPCDMAARGMPSLAIVVPTNLRFGHGPRVEGRSGRPRAAFGFGGRRWNLPLTDFEIGPAIALLPEGVYDLDDLGIPRPEHLFLAVSLGQEYEGWHYKLVAGVLRIG